MKEERIGLLVNPYGADYLALRTAIWDWACHEHGITLLEGDIDDLLARIEQAGWSVKHD